MIILNLWDWDNKKRSRWQNIKYNFFPFFCSIGELLKWAPELKEDENHNPLKPMKLHAGEWHNDDCYFPTVDTAVCNCNLVENKRIAKGSQPTEKEEEITYVQCKMCGQQAHFFKGKDNIVHDKNCGKEVAPKKEEKVYAQECHCPEIMFAHYHTAPKKEDVEDYEEYIKRHTNSHKNGEICMNCPPSFRGCCKKCWHKNTAHITSRDYCIDEFCSCHTPTPPTEDWEDKLEQKYGGYITSAEFKMLISDIKSLLSHQAQAIEEKLQEEFDKNLKIVAERTAQSVRAEIAGKVANYTADFCENSQKFKADLLALLVEGEKE